MNTNTQSEARHVLTRRGILLGSGATVIALSGCQQMAEIGASTGILTQEESQMVSAGGKAVGAMNIDKDEKAKLAYGESIALSVAAQFPLDNSAELNKYAMLVALTLLEATDDPSVPIFVGVLASEKIVACASPAGHVFVSRGAMRKMKDESELAGVLGHEMSHVLANDGMSALKQYKLAEAGSQAASAALGGEMKELAQLVDQGSQTILKRGYDQPQEFRADASGAKLAGRAGYDQSGLRRFLERLAANTANDADQWNSTHPPKAQRIARLGALPALPRPGATVATRFIKAIA